MPPYDAIVLAGGRATRLPGKLSLPGPDGRTLLAHCVGAVLATVACRVVFVGPDTPGLPGDARVAVTREEPAYAGPVAAVAAGLALVAGPLVVVVAGDSPRAANSVAALVAELAAAGEAVDAAVLVDADGRIQPLCAAYRTAALAAAVPGVASMMAVLDRLRVLTVPDAQGTSADVDDAESAARLGFAGPQR